MTKILHTLRFQLPAVAFGVLAGFLLLVGLFFHEMNGILVQTRRLAQSAEISDGVAGWMSTLSTGARERTKLMSLGEPRYLRSLQASLQESENRFQAIGRLGPDPAAQSTRQLQELHGSQAEYRELLEAFARDQAERRKSAQAREGNGNAASPPAADRVQSPQSTQASASPRTAHTAKSRRSAKRARTAKSARTLKRGGKSAPKQARTAARPAPAKPKSLAPPKQIDLDSGTNETFKSYEQVLREGLAGVQETMRNERKDRLRSLDVSVGRAKDRLVYSLLLLLAIVAYVAVILKWKVLDPMGKLKQGALEIGKGALGYQVKVESRNEMGELARVFNHMSLQLDQKRNAEVRLKRLEAIEQIVRSVNHEINNPLMIISGNAEYLLAVFESADEATRAKLESILAEVRRIFLVTQRLKEIKEPVTQDYIGAKDQMIDLARSSQVRERDF